jgi:hypothetical protein
MHVPAVQRHGTAQRCRVATQHSAVASCRATVKTRCTALPHSPHPAHLHPAPHIPPASPPRSSIGVSRNGPCTQPRTHSVQTLALNVSLHGAAASCRTAVQCRGATQLCRDAVRCRGVVPCRGVGAVHGTHLQAQAVVPRDARASPGGFPWGPWHRGPCRGPRLSRPPTKCRFVPGWPGGVRGHSVPNARCDVAQ